MSFLSEFVEQTQIEMTSSGGAEKCTLEDLCFRTSCYMQNVDKIILKGDFCVAKIIVVQ